MSISSSTCLPLNINPHSSVMPARKTYRLTILFNYHIYFLYSASSLVSWFSARISRYDTPSLLFPLISCFVFNSYLPHPSVTALPSHYILVLDEEFTASPSLPPSLDSYCIDYPRTSHTCRVPWAVVKSPLKSPFLPFKISLTQLAHKLTCVLSISLPSRLSRCHPSMASYWSSSISLDTLLWITMSLPFLPLFPLAHNLVLTLIVH